MRGDVRTHLSMQCVRTGDPWEMRDNVRTHLSTQCMRAGDLWKVRGDDVRTHLSTQCVRAGEKLRSLEYWGKGKQINGL